MDFAVIINSKIRYCSKEIQYAKFEIAIFADMLISQISQGQPWNLHKIHFKSEDGKDLILCIRRENSWDGENELITCLLIESKNDTAYEYQILEKFAKNISIEYPITDIHESLDDDFEGFQTLCDLMAATLFGDANRGLIDGSARSDVYGGGNQLIYAGIATNGLPVISQLYEQQSILTFEDEGKKELTTTILSGQLATISINAFIRAQCHVESIQIKISPTENKYIFFTFHSFGRKGTFILETLNAGKPNSFLDFNEKILKELNANECFSDVFGGGLKKYAPIKTYLANLENIFSQS